MGDASAPLTTTIEDGVAVLRFDDGKVNVLSYAAIAAFEEALDRAAEEASAVCIVGNAKATSAGFDLSVMNAGIESALDLVGAGGRMLLRLYTHPQPVVLAVTGHALAAGRVAGGVVRHPHRCRPALEDRAQRDRHRHVAAAVRHRARP